MSLTIFVIYDLFYHLRLENVLRRRTNSQEYVLVCKIKKKYSSPLSINSVWAPDSLSDTKCYKDGYKI